MHCRLLRLYGMARREHGSPFIWIDRISGGRGVHSQAAAGQRCRRRWRQMSTSRRLLFHSTPPVGHRWHKPACTPYPPPCCETNGCATSHKLPFCALRAEVRKEFTFQARRTVSFFLALLAVSHVFGCLLWIVLRAQHFPEGGMGGRSLRDNVTGRPEIYRAGIGIPYPPQQSCCTYLAALRRLFAGWQSAPSFQTPGRSS